LRALLISEPPSRMRKGQSCKVDISILRLEINYLIHEANISKTDPVTLLF